MGGWGGYVALPGCTVPRHGGEVGFRHEQGEAGCFRSPFHWGAGADGREDNDKVRRKVFRFCFFMFFFSFFCRFRGVVLGFESYHSVRKCKSPFIFMFIIEPSLYFRSEWWAFSSGAFMLGMWLWFDFFLFRLFFLLLP